MAFVELEVCYVHLGSDLAQFVTFDAEKIEDSNPTRGEVRTYAAGRRRRIGAVGRERQVTVDAALVDPLTRATLLGWCGIVCLFRDPRGRSVWVTFEDVPVTERPVTELVDVSLTLTEVTVPVGV